MTAKKKIYCIALQRSDIFVQCFEATSVSDAIAMAEHDYDENDELNWKHKDGSIDGFSVWDVAEIGGDR